MNAYIVIAYQDIQSNSIIRIYDDTTERFFSDYQIAIEYSQYLNEKGKQTIVSDILIRDSINIQELKIQDALSKLTHTEIQLLGLNT